MAPPRQYEPPHEQLYSLLVQARIEGLSFEDAWIRAVRPGRPIVMVTAGDPPYGAIRWPTDSKERIAWQLALTEVKDSWRRTYQHRPATRRETAALVLWQHLRSSGIPVSTAVASAA
jgi:hypothetical protein